jgi:thiamine pyrophosphokinase
MVFFMPRVVIFVNGHLSGLEQVHRLFRVGDTFIAADGGTRHALSLGILPSLVIGDLDSLSENDLHMLEAAGTEILRFPSDKNETDFELALEYAVSKRFDEILIIAALGDRLDQTLGNLSLLTSPALVGLDIRMDDGWERAWFVRTRTQVEGNPGDIVSLIPWGAEVTGISTSGLRWPLREETLHPHKTRGLSNVLLGEEATISLKSGLLLIVQSHPRQVE